MSAMRVLVTGASGFVGRHLCERLRSERLEIATMPHVRLRVVESVTEMLRAFQPTHMIHLAGISDGNTEDYASCYEAHLLKTARLLEAARHVVPGVRILMASSSAVYGATTPQENPLTEERGFRPITHYGTSKVAQEMVALQYAAAHHLWTVPVRTFNLVGPGQPSNLLLSNLARQIAQAECEGAPLTVRVGNLSPRRDYTDVRDAAGAYRLLMEHGEPGTAYNVCSGRSTSVRECLDLLAGLVNGPLQVIHDDARVRQVEIPDQIGDARRLMQATGWQPRIPLARSAHDLLEEWRQRVRNERGVPA